MHRISVSRRSRERAFAALLLGLLMAQLDSTVVVVALPSIADDLHVGSATSVFAVYLLAVTVTTPLHAALGDVLGRRPVFMVAVGAFAVGTLACALSPTLTLLLVARASKGSGAAAW